MKNFPYKKLTKKEFNAMGGLSHPKTFRIMTAGKWSYYLSLA